MFRRSEVRRAALDCLQSVLLASQVKIASEQAWKQCFERLLIPLLHNIAQFRFALGISCDCYRPEAIRDEKAPRTPASKDRTSQDSLPMFDIRLKGATVLFQVRTDFLTDHVHFLSDVSAQSGHASSASGCVTTLDPLLTDWC